MIRGLSRDQTVPGWEPMDTMDSRRSVQMPRLRLLSLSDYNGAPLDSSYDWHNRRHDFPHSQFLSPARGPPYSLPCLQRNLNISKTLYLKCGRKLVLHSILAKFGEWIDLKISQL